MNEINISEISELFVRQLSQGGVLLTAGARPNPMTVGWGSLGIYWGKSILSVPIRHSRYTHGLIEQSGEFSLTIPLDDRKKELGFCGTRSGRDTDKFAALGLNTLPCREIGTAVPELPGIHLECRVLTSTELDTLPADIREKWYSDHDLHTLYLAQVVAAYRT